MSNHDHWMPLYVGDYLADTMELNAAQHGAYLLLLMYYWRNGPLPADEARLAKIARTDRKSWDRDIWPLLEGFFQLRDGRLHQKRADRELEKAGKANDRVQHERELSAERMRRMRARRNGEDDPTPTGTSDAQVTRNEGGNNSRNSVRNSVVTPPERDGKSYAPPSQTLPPVHNTTTPQGELAHARSARARKAPHPLPSDWKPSTKSQQLAATLGFDEPRLSHEADRMRAFAWSKNYQLPDWDWRFETWLREASYREKNRDEKPAKSQHQQIREDGGLGTFLGGVPYEETIPPRPLTAITGGRK